MVNIMLPNYYKRSDLSMMELTLTNVAAATIIVSTSLSSTSAANVSPNLYCVYVIV
jgi:hypothetical protein